MPIPTPFHSRTALINQSHDWREWSGYLAAGLYEPSPDREYYAVRNSAALFDISPLRKYEITGPAAAAVIDRIMTRDLADCAVGQIMYSPWCDDAGKMIDAGLIWRLADDRYRITAAERNLRWFQDCGFGLAATVTDVSTAWAALAVQGPHAGAILHQIAGRADLDSLRPFHLLQTDVAGLPLTITRTGYTGDLGYELWVAPVHAPRLWDILIEGGRNEGLLPAGLAALDIARIEAGLPLIHVDYIPAPAALTEAQKSSPFDLGLEWAVALDKETFVGRPALLADKERGPGWLWVGLEALWEDIEALYAAVDLTPQLAGPASRSPAPVYKEGRQIGQATSHTYSPLLKKYIALASLERRAGVGIGDTVDLEMIVAFSRRTARARVVKLPFFDPDRRRAPAPPRPRAPASPGSLSPSQ